MSVPYAMICPHTGLSWKKYYIPTLAGRIDSCCTTISGHR